MAHSPSGRRIALSESQLNNASETRQLLSALVHLASDLNSTLDLTSLLRIVLTKARDLMDVEGASLFFLDEGKGEINREVLLSPVDQIQYEPRTADPDASIAGRVHRSQRPFFCNDLAAETVEATRESGVTPVRTVLAVPLVAKDKQLGVAQVVNRKHHGTFIEDDLYLFKAFADMAAVSIANARLHEEALEHRKLDREMAVAREIQRSFLPAAFPTVAGFTFEGFMEPARQVGGDYYDIFTTPTHHTCLAVGDVSGKGAAAALYMACLHSELHLAMEFIEDPKAVMSRLNMIMHERSQRGAFISLLLLILAPGAATGTLLSAGHPEPFLYDAQTGSVTAVARNNGYPLGVMRDQTYVATTVDLPRGCIFLAYTDGVVEARNRQGEEFGLERLQVALREAAQNDSPVVPVIQERLRAFVDGAPQYDDITLAVAQAQADTPTTGGIP